MFYLVLADKKVLDFSQGLRKMKKRTSRNAVLDTLQATGIT